MAVDSTIYRGNHNLILDITIDTDIIISYQGLPRLKNTLYIMFIIYL